MKRIYRDEAFIDKMVAQLADFDRLVDNYTAVLRADARPHNTIEEYMEHETPAPAPSEMLASAPVDVSVDTPAPAVLEKFDIQVRETAPAGPPSLRLGEISTRLGFAVSAAFLGALGFDPAARDKSAILFHESDFKAICAAILRHVSAVQAKF